MPHLQTLSKRLGRCVHCGLEQTIYLLPGQAGQDVTCRRCRLPLALGPESLTEAWKTDEWTFLPVTRRVTPVDLPLFRRREELIATLPPWEWLSLGFLPSRIELGLVVIRRVRTRCDLCGTKDVSFCLTEYALRRLACSNCRHPAGSARKSEHRAGLEEDGTCAVIDSLTPLTPVIVGRPPALTVMSADDLELLGIL